MPVQPLAGGHCQCGESGKEREAQVGKDGAELSVHRGKGIFVESVRASARRPSQISRHELSLYIQALDD
jgi:hypothetical protein